MNGSTNRAFVLISMGGIYVTIPQSQRFFDCIFSCFSFRNLINSQAKLRNDISIIKYDFFLHFFSFYFSLTGFVKIKTKNPISKNTVMKAIIK